MVDRAAAASLAVLEVLADASLQELRSNSGPSRTSLSIREEAIVYAISDCGLSLQGKARLAKA